MGERPETYSVENDGAGGPERQKGWAWNAGPKLSSLLPPLTYSG